MITTEDFTRGRIPTGPATLRGATDRHYEVEFRNETGHPLELISACHGAGDTWRLAPPAAVAIGETMTFRVDSWRRAAGGVVIYRDVLRGGLVTFCGNASGRMGGSCTYATPTDGMLVVGPQGYLDGVHAQVHATYVLG